MQLSQSDMTQGMGITQESEEFKKTTGQIGLWMGSVFSGMPSFILGLAYSDDLKLSIYNFFAKLIVEPTLILFLFFVATYLLVYVYTGSIYISLFASIAISLSSYHILSLEAGHNSKIRAIAYIPLILTGLLMLKRQKWLLGTAVAALGFAFHILCGHYQITYYFGLALAVYFVIYLIFEFKDKKLKNALLVTGCFALAGVLGLASNLGKIWSTMEYQKQSIRGKYELTPKDDVQSDAGGLDKDYAFSWSQGIGESFTLLIPGLYGGSSQEELGRSSEVYKVLRQNNVGMQPMPMYHGDQPFTGGPIYAGAIVCFLFVFALFVLPKKHKIWIASIFVIFLAIAWGKNFSILNYTLFDYFPYFNKFRAVSMALFVPLAIMALAGAMALNTLLKSENKQQYKKPVLLAGGIVGGICLCAALFAGAFDLTGPSDAQLPEWLLDALRADRKSLIVRDSFRSLFFVAIGAGAIYALVIKKLKPVYVTAIIAVATLADLWMYNTRYLNDSDYTKQKAENSIQPTEADLAILRDKEIGYRVFNLQNPFNDGRTSYFHRSVGGYHPAKMRRYQDLIERHLSQNNMNVLQMLNVKYVIRGPKVTEVMRLPGVCGAAWLVDSLRPVQGADAEIEALKEFAPASVAIVDVEKFPVQKLEFTEAATDTIYITQYNPNQVDYDYKAENERFAVFSEIYYQPGWNAYVDGKLMEHIRVNYVLRGMLLPAGEHKVSFVFEPQSVKVGGLVASIFTYLIFGLVIVAGAWEWRQKQKINKG